MNKDHTIESNASQAIEETYHLYFFQARKVIRIRKSVRLGKNLNKTDEKIQQHCFVSIKLIVAFTLNIWHDPHSNKAFVNRCITSSTIANMQSCKFLFNKDKTKPGKKFGNNQET